MQVDIAKVPPFMEIWVKCIDDTLPEKFEPVNWISNGENYKVLGHAESLTSDDVSLIIAKPNSNKPMKPNADYWGYKSTRFVNAIMPIFLN